MKKTINLSDYFYKQEAFVKFLEDRNFIVTNNENDNKYNGISVYGDNNSVQAYQKLETLKKIFLFSGGHFIP